MEAKLLPVATQTFSSPRACPSRQSKSLIHVHPAFSVPPIGLNRFPGRSPLLESGRLSGFRSNVGESRAVVDRSLEIQSGKVGECRAVVDRWSRFQSEKAGKCRAKVDRLSAFRSGKVGECRAVVDNAGGAETGTEEAASGAEGAKRGGEEKVSVVRGVLFDMDGVLCNSEEPSRDAAVALFAEMGVTVTGPDFYPFMGTGEANFLGGVARKFGLESFDIVAAKKRFFEIYIEKYAKPDSGLEFPGALDLVLQCKSAGLKLAVASSADRIKVDANLAAAGLPQTNFDAVVSADLFENLKPAPDIFLAAAKGLELPPEECVVVEDALAGVQAAKAAGMRCIAVTTTLAEEKLWPAGPSLVRDDISKISLEDVLSLRAGGAGSAGRKGLDEFPSVADAVISAFRTNLDEELVVPVGFMTTKRDVVKFGSLLSGLYILSLVVRRWQGKLYPN